MRNYLFLLGAGVLVVACGSETTATGSDELNAPATCGGETYAKMIAAPILPPRWIGGVDLSSPTATIDDVERTLCASTQVAEDETTKTGGWGIAQAHEVTMTYDKETREVSAYSLNAGYKGRLDFRSRPSSLGDPTKPNPRGEHTYSIGIGTPILRDGQTWEINWSFSCGTGFRDCFDAQATELYDAMMYTFAPDLPSTQDNCIREQTCLAKSFPDGEGIFGVRPLGIYIDVADTRVPQPAASTPTFIYGFVNKTFP